MENKFKMDTFALNIKVRGNKVKENFFKFENGQTREQIKKHIKKIQEMAKKAGKNSKLIVALKYDAGWRGDKTFDLDEEPLLFDPDNFYNGEERNANHLVKRQNTFKEFIIYTIPAPALVGGSNKANDCLFVAIRKLTEGQIMCTWDTPSKFKARLGLDRADKVPISKFSEIEKGLKINLNCEGDAIYTSEGKYTRTCNLVLKNQHYDINKAKLTNPVAIQNFKKVGFYEQVDSQYHIITEDFETNTDIKGGREQLEKTYKNYMLLDKTRFTQNENNPKKLAQMFEDYQTQGLALISETNGAIDIFKFPFPSQLAQRILHYRSRTLQDTFEPLTQTETYWIDNAFMGGIIYAEEGHYTNTTCFDQNSQYANYLSNNGFMLPTKQGEFKTVTNDDIAEFASFGIYRCKVTCTDENKAKLFRFNHKHYYTQSDIKNAYNLGFNVDMIQDGQANALLYARDNLVTGPQYFKPTIDYLYSLKTKYPIIKTIISAIWGALMTRDTKDIWIKEEDNEIELDDEREIFTIQRFEGIHKIITVPKRKMFKYNTARLGPFLTSYVRCKMAETIVDNFKLENVVRIHTDGVIVKNGQSMKADYMGHDIGKFKVEKFGDCTIHHANFIEWNKKV